MRSAIRNSVRNVAILYLIALLVICGFMHFDNGARWPVTLFLFSPRWAVAVPLIALVPLTLITRLRLTSIYFLHGALIVFPILGCQISWTDSLPSTEQQTLQILTCNLGGGTIRTNQLAALVREYDIDALVLQECSSSTSRILFRQLGWGYQQQGNIAIGSPLELGEMQVLARQSPARYHAVVAVSCQIHLPMSDRSADPNSYRSKSSGTAYLVGVHLPTFRPALEKMYRFDLDAGTAINDLGIDYRDLAQQIRRHVNGIEIPTVIAGDFNTPVESVYFREPWSDYQNAFSEVGKGLGYTKYTRFHGIRIDHVLADHHWRVDAATVGPDLGGDHRPVIVTLSLAG